MKIIGKILLFVLAIGVGLASLRYMNFEVQDILIGREAMLDQWTFKLGFYTHVLFGPVALMVGPFQFLPKFRVKYLSVHRILGKIYVACCLLGAVSGFLVAFYTYGGWIASIGFALLAVLWFFTTLKAFQTVRKKEIDRHRIWMHRSYALTLAAVTLRLWLQLLQGVFLLDFIAAYQIVAWLSWVPNLLIIEWVIRRQYTPDQLELVRWT